MNELSLLAHALSVKELLIWCKDDLMKPMAVDLRYLAPSLGAGKGPRRRLGPVMLPYPYWVCCDCAAGPYLEVLYVQCINCEHRKCPGCRVW